MSNNLLNIVETFGGHGGGHGHGGGRGHGHGGGWGGRGHGHGGGGWGGRGWGGYNYGYGGYGGTYYPWYYNSYYPYNYYVTEPEYVPVPVPVQNTTQATSQQNVGSCDCKVDSENATKFQITNNCTNGSIPVCTFDNQCLCKPF